MNRVQCSPAVTVVACNKIVKFTIINYHVLYDLWYLKTDEYHSKYKVIDIQQIYNHFKIILVREIESIDPDNIEKKWRVSVVC